jgi:hypothetical protein
MDNIFTWIDRLCNYSYIRFEKEPAPTLRELFSQKIFDKPMVMKVVQQYILASMKPVDGDVKYENVVVTPWSLLHLQVVHLQIMQDPIHLIKK